MRLPAVCAYEQQSAARLSAVDGIGIGVGADVEINDRAPDQRWSGATFTGGQSGGGVQHYSEGQDNQNTYRSGGDE